MSISGISMSRSYVSVPLYVCLGGIYAVWLFKKKNLKVTFLWRGDGKGHAPPLVCVKSGEYLYSEGGLCGKSRLAEFFFCSRSICGQLSDETDKSSAHSPCSSSPILSLVLLSSLFFGVFRLLFYFLNDTLLELTVLFWNWPSSNV